MLGGMDNSKVPEVCITPNTCFCDNLPERPQSISIQILCSGACEACVEEEDICTMKVNDGGCEDFHHCFSNNPETRRRRLPGHCTAALSQEKYHVG